MEHGKVFEKFPITGFRKTKILKDVIVRAKVRPLEKKKGSCTSCGGFKCKTCCDY